jgi:hypothetical protein
MRFVFFCGRFRSVRPSLARAFQHQDPIVPVNASEADGGGGLSDQTGFTVKR